MAEKDTENTARSKAKAVNGAKPFNGAAANSATKGGRPSVVPLQFKDKDSLQRAYMQFTKGGGLFLPTNVPYDMNEEIFLLVTLPGSKKSLPVPGKVVWQHPSTAAEGKQGVGIEFKGREGISLRNTIEGMLGARIGNPNPTYTM